MAEITDEQQTAADRTRKIADWNRGTVNWSLDQSNKLFDTADKQNALLADKEYIQNRQKTESDRFQAQRSLQNAARGLYNTVGSGLNGSAAGNIANLTMGQQDADNVDYWDTLRQNNNVVDNAYQESVNQNYLNRLSAAADAEARKADIEADTAAALNNINQDLYVSPWTLMKDDNVSGGSTVGSQGTYDRAAASAKKDNTAQNARQSQSGYITSGDPLKTTGRYSQPSTALNDYFSRLLRSI